MLDCNAPGVEDANVWGLINLKKGDKKLRRKILNKFNNESKVLDAVNEIEDSKNNRRVAFRSVKRQLNLWKGPIHQNRLADQLIFPLNDNAIEFSNSKKCQQLKNDAYIESIKTENTTLNGQLYSALYKKPLKVDSSNNMDKCAKKVSKQLLEKISMRDKERFLFSCAAARNKRQNKIKSKNYHRHLKSRSLKEYEKESEYLRQNNPREFADRLLKSELNRVKERASLRHRGGSKFAKLQKLRAKYDNEARSAVAEMHEISREVTKKHGFGELSDTDESDIDVSSESESESNETDLDPSDNDDNNEDVSHLSLWWNEKPNTTLSEMEMNKSSLNVLSTTIVGETLEKSNIVKSILTVPEVLQTENVLDEESNNLDPNSECFFRTLQESFAGDPALQEKFNQEKIDTVNEEALKDIDAYIPGWNAWTGPGTEEFDEKRRNAKMIKAPKVDREDSRKSHVIIKRRVNQDFKKHLVKSIPYPFNFPEQFDTFISQPICREWTTESTHSKLIKPKVIVQSGRIIRPISKSAAILRDKDVEHFVKQSKNVG